MHGTMVSYGHRVHPVFLTFFEKVGNADCPVKKAVLGMEVEVGEACSHVVSLDAFCAFLESVVQNGTFHISAGKIGFNDIGTCKIDPGLC